MVLAGYIHILSYRHTAKVKFSPFDKMSRLPVQALLHCCRASKTKWRQGNEMSQLPQAWPNAQSRYI